MKMRLCLLLFLNVRVRLSLFGNLSEDEAVPVAVPECEGEAAPTLEILVKMRLCLLLFLNVRLRLFLFGNLREDEAVPVAAPECEAEAVPLWKS